jgi:hypothetical protein
LKVSQLFIFYSLMQDFQFFARDYDRYLRVSVLWELDSLPLAARSSRVVNFSTHTHTHTHTQTHTHTHTYTHTHLHTHTHTHDNTHKHTHTHTHTYTHTHTHKHTQTHTRTNTHKHTHTQTHTHTNTHTHTHTNTLKFFYPIPATNLSFTCKQLVNFEFQSCKLLNRQYSCYRQYATG